MLKMMFAALLMASGVKAQHPAEAVPDFTFFKWDKSPFTNNNVEKGKLLFFVFFDASCEHCQHAVQTLSNRYPELKNVAVYLITLDNQQTAYAFINKYGKTLYGKKNVTLLQDVHNEFITKFGPRKYPSMFLYSPEKKLLAYEDDEASMFRFFNQINAHPK